MSGRAQRDVWASGPPYDAYIGRWSRLVARDFVKWLALPPRLRWIDIGCGTGALTAAVLHHAQPALIQGVDPSKDFARFAAVQVNEPSASFTIGDARRLPLASQSIDAAVSGLVLNFVPEPDQAVADMARVLRFDGVVAAYVWDYAGEMQLLRHFWDAACELDAAALDLDEGRRFPLCNPLALQELFVRGGLKNVEVTAIEVPTTFGDFDDLWSPFLGGQGPAPTYLASLDGESQLRLRERVRASVAVIPEETIRLKARAWAVRGTR